MTDAPEDQEVGRFTQTYNGGLSWDIVSHPKGEWVSYEDYRALLDAKKAAEAERDEAFNQLDSARHSEACLRKRCGELWERAEKLAEWNRAMVEKAASGGTLDGYREMGNRIAELEGKIETLLAEQKYRYIGKDGKPVLARDLEDERDGLKEKLALVIPFFEAHVRDLERRFEETDDGGAYHDWQDAQAILDKLKGERGDG